jgi:hypothetical protein
MVTRTDVVRFRIPGPEVEPARGSSPRIGAAFAKHPLLTWLLFPSTGGGSEAWRFWRDGAYGAFLRAFDGIDSDENHPMRTASRWTRELAGLESVGRIPADLASALFPDLPEAGTRAAAEMTRPLIALWRGWGVPEGQPSDQISSMPGP